jgi:hypothetical protein
VSFNGEGGGGIHRDDAGIDAANRGLMFALAVTYWRGRQQLKGGDPMSSEFTAFGESLVRITGVTA